LRGGRTACGAALCKISYVGLRAVIDFTIYNRAVNTIRRNSPLPTLLFAVLLTGVLIGVGWALSAEVRLQGNWLYLVLLAGFILSAGRPRRPKTRQAFTPSDAAPRRS
jgi:hypothetical protein